MSGNDCTCGERFRDAEDFRDHLPCPGSAADQARDKLKVLADAARDAVEYMIKLKLDEREEGGRIIEGLTAALENACG